MKRILFVDNDVKFLKARAEFLEEAGYSLTLASSPEEAGRLLSEGHFHLAILDLRLVNDRDERDFTGLNLAKKVHYRQVPKIVLTNFPSYQAVREALGVALDGLPPAVGFVAKQEGPEALIRAVEKVFSQHVRVNWDLVIEHNEDNPVTLPNLATLIAPDLEGHLLLNRAKELEDLFRRIFYSEGQIKIDRLLWQREGRVALGVFAFAEGKASEALVVVCGQNALVIQEARRYKEFAPKAPGQTATVLNRSNETAHFAANVYAIASVDLGDVHSLARLYRTGPEKLFNIALNNLFDKTLVEWHQEKRIPEGSKTLDEVYQKRLGLTKQRITKKRFEQRVQSLVRQIPSIGPEIEQGPKTLTIQFGGQSFSYSDPIPILYRASSIGRPVLLMNTPGRLSGDNILTDVSGRTWLTDFADAGAAPVLWNFVSLEAAIRFDWVEKTKLQWLHDMEQQLVSNEFSSLYPNDVEPPLRKPLRAIRTIRRLASQVVDKDIRPYQLGILFHAANRLADANTASLTPTELTRLTHLLLAAAMLSNKIEQSQQVRPLQAERNTTGIRIDTANRAVWVDEARVLLRGQGYDLLIYFYEHRNQLVTRRELIEQVFRERYDEMDQSQIRRLNTAVHRLREQIGRRSGHSEYLVTEPGVGYRLLLRS